VKVKDIKIGMRVWTNIAQDCVFVEVVEDRETKGRRYTVKRVDNGKVLNTGRAPAALHETRGPWVKFWDRSASAVDPISSQPSPWMKPIL
jgi:hypothetical protein